MANPDVIRKVIDDLVGADPDAVGYILDALHDACDATAEHVRINWQDSDSARAWVKIGVAIERARNTFTSFKPY